MENKFYVYEWIRLDTNEPFYVGKGKNNRCYKLNRNQYFNNIINTLDCIVNILHDNLTEEEAFQYECWYIHEYKYEIGYTLANMTDGGEGCAGKITSEETKQKISKANKGKLVFTEEHKIKIGLAHKNKRLSIETKQKISEKCKGYRHTEEAKKAISEKHKGKKRSEESIQKTANANKGRKCTDETKQKISKVNKGRKLSEKTKLKISESGKGKIISKESKEKSSKSNKGQKRSEKTKINMKIANRNKHIQRCINSIRLIYGYIDMKLLNKIQIEEINIKNVKDWRKSAIIKQNELIEEIKEKLIKGEYNE